MSYLNLNYGLVIAEDVSDRSPNIRLTDISKSIQNVCVDNEDSNKKHLNPGDVLDIVTTLRSIAWNSSTQLQFLRYIANQDPVRMTYTGTGTAPTFRTNRIVGGDATTTVSITRISPYMARITQTAGTTWTLGSVQIGDIIKFEKDTDAFTQPLSDINKGKSYVVQAKGSNYIDYFDNGESSLDANIVLGANFEFAVRVFSPGPVKIGDTLDVTGNSINPANIGQFIVTDLSYDYLEFNNPFGINETVLHGTNVLNVYDYLIGFIHLRATGQIKIRTDEQVEWTTYDKVGPEALYMGSVRAYKVQAFNDTQEIVSVSVQDARIVG